MSPSPPSRSSRVVATNASPDGVIPGYHRLVAESRHMVVLIKLLTEGNTHGAQGDALAARGDGPGRAGLVAGPDRPHRGHGQGSAAGHGTDGGAHDHLRRH